MKKYAFVFLCVLFWISACQKEDEAVAETSSVQRISVNVDELFQSFSFGSNGRTIEDLPGPEDFVYFLEISKEELEGWETYRESYYTYDGLSLPNTLDIELEPGYYYCYLTVYYMLTADDLSALDSSGFDASDWDQYEVKNSLEPEAETDTTIIISDTDLDYHFGLQHLGRVAQGFSGSFTHESTEIVISSFYKHYVNAYELLINNESNTGLLGDVMIRFNNEADSHPTSLVYANNVEDDFYFIHDHFHELSFIYEAPSGLTHLFYQTGGGFYLESALEFYYLEIAIPEILTDEQGEFLGLGEGNPTLSIDTPSFLDELDFTEGDTLHLGG
ncbi:MAG: hypothetical protein KI790_05455 [Cyclobacteriaceae bacterium]|nr:hypothetical protein [Cyclobacteriaceae bacterium HetDA_MAG_MS6]